MSRLLTNRTLLSMWAMSMLSADLFDLLREPNVRFL